MRSKLALTDFSIKISVFSKDEDVSSNQNFIVTNSWNHADSLRDLSCNFSNLSSFKSIVCISKFSIYPENDFFSSDNASIDFN